MSNPSAATVYFNRDTTNMWVEYATGGTDQLGQSPGVMAASYVVAHKGWTRTGDWLPAYGPVQSCTVLV